MKKLLALPVVFAVLISNIAQSHEEFLEWVPMEAVKAVKDVWEHRVSIYSEEDLNEMFGFSSKEEALSCNFKNPVRLIKVDYCSYKEGDNIIDHIELLDGYSFNIYLNNIRRGDITIEYRDGLWLMQVMGGSGGEIKEDRVGNIYKKYPSSLGYKIYGFPEAYFVVKGDTVIEVNKFDYSTMESRGFDPVEHMINKKKSLENMKKHPSYEKNLRLRKEREKTAKKMVEKIKKELEGEKNEKTKSSEFKDYPIRPLPFTKVKLTDAFWRPRMETNRTVTIPHAFKKCEETGRLDNFAIAGGLVEGEQKGIYPFDDTDVFKTLEGASYALMLHPNPSLEAYLDSVIALVGAAQEEDGYLYTVRTNKADSIRRWFGDERWEKLDSSHELYNAGHLFEAAAAHYQATGKRNLLDIALKLADLIDESFGPGKIQRPPGHQVIELGLAKLYRVTGDGRYIRLAKFLLDVRGLPLDGRKLRGEYNQDHEPVLEQEEAVGHAVRAGYMYAGMADVAALTGDKSYIKAIDRLWENVIGKKLYLTGGIGASGSNEGFSHNYDLPNLSSYNETCASIANVYWNHRLFLLHGDAKYLDVMERTLYNALLSGISLDGTRFFYPNPLESVGQHERSEWFECACCPGNLTRFMASLPGYMYAVKEGQIFVNLYASNEAEIEMNGQTIRLSQKTSYPWEGAVRLEMNPEKENVRFALCLRIPGWARGKPLASDLYRYMNDQPAEVIIEVNGEKVPYRLEKGFAPIRRRWRSGDTVKLHLPMHIRRVVAHDSVKADRGKVALERGPLVFCAEWCDHAEGHVRNLLLHDDRELSTEFLSDRLQGIQVIRGRALSCRLNEGENLEKEEEPLMMIPYYAWAHRGKGEMTVWLAREESAICPVGLPTFASKSQVKASSGRNPGAVNDQLEPESSIDQDLPFFHWWPHRGTKEWIQYDFEKPEEISSVEVYWFDDTGTGKCRVPLSWRVLYLDNGKWRPVYTTDSYGIAKDQYNRVIFETVRTQSLRLEIQSQDGWAGGIHEWKVR